MSLEYTSEEQRIIQDAWHNFLDIVATGKAGGGHDTSNKQCERWHIMASEEGAPAEHHSRIVELLRYIVYPTPGGLRTVTGKVTDRHAQHASIYYRNKYRADIRIHAKAAIAAYDAAVARAEAE